MDPALHDLILVGGPFATGAALVGLAFIRGWLVPGGIYEREVKRADEATDLAARQGHDVARILDILEARREAP